jgi:hypothetical protein
MAVLKTLVVLMGVLIVLGTGFLVYTLSTGFRPGASYSATIELPAGASVAGLVGLGDRLALRVTQPGAPERILIVDPARGRVLGTLTVESKP